MSQSFMSFLSETSSKKDPMLSTTTSMMQHPTGYMYLDYMAGSYLTVYDENENPLYNYHNIGITGGSVSVLISKSQGGKTSLATSMGAGIIEPWLNDPVMSRYFNPDLNPDLDKSGAPLIQILDTEKTLPLDYVKKITQYRNKELSKHIMINPITTDKDMIRCVEKHIKYKMDTMKMICMPMNDIYGTPIKTYPPTVLIIDSMSQMLLEDCDGVGQESYDKLTQNTAGARRARIVSALYSQLVNYAKKYNIAIFSINHINKLPSMGPMPVAKQYRGLKQGETIGGGERAIYLAANILRLDVIKSVGGESSSAIQLGDGVTGFISLAKWIKTKSNSLNNTCQMVYTNFAGYDRLLSNIWNAKEIGDLQKVGNYYCLDSRPDVKFTMKTVRDTFQDHPEMIVPLYLQLRGNCEKYLDNPDSAEKHNKKLMEELQDDLKDEVRSGNYSENDANALSNIFGEIYNG